MLKYHHFWGGRPLLNFQLRGTRDPVPSPRIFDAHVRISSYGNVFVAHLFIRTRAAPRRDDWGDEDDLKSILSIHCP